MTKWSMQDEPEEKNAIISGMELTNGDHGLLSGWIYLDYGSGGAQGFGGYALFVPSTNRSYHDQANLCGLWIWRVMQVAGVKTWDQLKGKTVRVRGTRDKVTAIGHIIKNDWFDTEAEFAVLKGRTA